MKEKYCIKCGSRKVNDGLNICFVCYNKNREQSTVFGRFCRFCGCKLSADEVVHIGDGCASCELEYERRMAEQ